MESGSEKKFPLSAKDYKLCEEIGDGVSATVHRALCIPLSEVVAIKVLDLEKCNNDLVGTLIHSCSENMKERLAYSQFLGVFASVLFSDITYRRQDLAFSLLFVCLFECVMP